jgi:hypothetical protein
MAKTNVQESDIQESVKRPEVVTLEPASTALKSSNHDDAHIKKLYCLELQELSNFQLVLPNQHWMLQTRARNSRTLGSSLSISIKNAS